MDRLTWASLRSQIICVAVILATIGSLAGFGRVAVAQDSGSAERGTVTFTALNDSGLSGTAVLTPRGQQTEVDMRINGAVGEHPTHIHTGTCDDLDPNPKYPLNNVELNTTELMGMSDTVVDVPLDELLSQPHLILIHKSPDDLNTYYACGNIVADTSAGNVAQAAGSGSTSNAEVGTPGTPAKEALGNMGSGASTFANGSGLAAVLAVIAAALALAGVTMRHRVEC